MIIVNSEEKINELIDDLKSNDFVAVDTEFIREEKKIPLLCLIQLATKSHAYIIDPISIDINFLKEIFADQNLKKIFHSAKQDIEILKLYGFEIKNIYDTQLYEMILSTKENISYQSIVLNYVGKNLKKRYGLSDWTKRPLSKKQLLYAEEDVTFLRNVYQKQIIELKKLHRENWIDDEIKFMLNDSRKNSFENSISENNYPLLFKLLNWREEKAQEKKVAPELLISDKIIKSICKKGIGFVRKLRDARNLTDEIYQEFLNYAESITKDFFIEEKNFERISEISLLKTLLDIKSEENNIAPIMIASINDLHKFLSGDKNVKFLQGWRNEIFGNFAVALLDGKIKLGIKNNKAVLYV